jgi:hypothetical protein
LRVLLRLLSVLAALEAFYGLVQQLAGFPSWDLRWINTSGYVALGVGGFDRSFGSFSSSQEYAVFLCIGLVTWVGLFRRGRLVWVVLQLAAIALIGTAIVLESQRSALVIVVFALGAMAAARAGRRPTGAILAGALFLLILYVVVGQFASASDTQGTATNSTSALTSHLVSGIANPTGQQSTLPGHLSRVESGIASGFTQPIGHGTGSITLAATNLGNAGSLGTEYDPGNTGEAFGMVGLLLYLIVLGRSLSTEYGLAMHRRDSLSIAVLGIAAATLFQWLNGDLYSVAWLFWLSLGWADRQQLQTAMDMGTSDLAPAERWGEAPASGRRLRSGAPDGSM